MESKPEDPKLAYEFTDDIHVLLHAASFQDWTAYPLAKDGISVTDFGVTDFTPKSGKVHAQLAWTGTVESTSYSTGEPVTSTVTAWTAEVTLPLVDVGSPPK